MEVWAGAGAGALATLAAVWIVARLRRTKAVKHRLRIEWLRDTDDTTRPG